MAERKGEITSKGTPLTLVGNVVQVGDMAPDFQVLDFDLKPVKLSDFAGKTRIIASVPSLDTNVCHLETIRFNKEAERLASDVVIMTISMDLPFAQKRWCEETKANRIKILSDYRDASFGEAFGVLIKELRLLARAVFIIDKTDRIRYIQLVREVSEEPDYDDVLAALAKI